MQIIHQHSANFGDRKDGARPSYIVIHGTWMESAAAALDRLCDPSARVSSHYLIDEDGQVFQLVDDDKRAWHCGVSCWRGQADMNSHTIGIELQNNGSTAYSPKQITALIQLCEALLSRHKSLSRKWILAHSDIAPIRKDDPGAHFPWGQLAAHNLGLMPPKDLSLAQLNPPLDLLSDHDKQKRLVAGLCAIGYDGKMGDQQDEAAMRHAFLLHYFAGSDDTSLDRALAAACWLEAKL